MMRHAWQLWSKLPAGLDIYCTISVTCVELLIGFVPPLVALSFTV